jgi:hypothetical protein
MDILSLIILFIIMGLVIGYIIRPLNNPRRSRTAKPVKLKDTLRTEYQFALTRIRELELEYREGKISEDDYSIRLHELKRKAAAYLVDLSHINQSDKKSG